MGDEVVGGAVRLQRAGERGVELGGSHGIHEAGLGGGFDQGVRGDSAAAGLGEGTGQEEGDRTEVLGDDVVLVGHRVFSEGQDGEAETVAAELGGERGIGENLGGLEGDAPGGEQGGEGGGGGRRRLLAHHRIRLRRGHLGGDREGVEAGDDGAAVEHVLVDGELGFRGDVGGVEHAAAP